MDVVVLGSLNMDLVAKVPRLPKPGETISGSDFTSVPGGKGANQAVAAARLGAKTAMVGRVGNDSIGQTLRTYLQVENIDVRGVVTSERSPSGTALISVSPTDNQIIVVPGANGEVGEADLEQLVPYFDRAKVLLLQFEIPMPIVEMAAALAYTAGLTVIVDPAPATEPLPPDVYDYISILTPNQTEAAVLTGQAVNDIQDAIAAAETLQSKGADAVIIKMGALGSVCATASGSFAMPVYHVDPLDTVAAGDAFNGGLAAALSQMNRAPDAPTSTDDLRAAMDYASAVAAIAVTQSGAQSAMPTAAAVKEFLKIQNRR